MVLRRRDAHHLALVCSPDRQAHRNAVVLGHDVLERRVEVRERFVDRGFVLLERLAAPWLTERRVGDDVFGADLVDDV